MKIKKGDKVKVITGSYKGTVAEVIKAIPEQNKIVVEGVNIVKKHVKPSQMNPDGGIMEKEAPIHVSNVMIYDEKAKVAGRVGYTVKDDKKVRINKKTNAQIKGDK